MRFNPKWLSGLVIWSDASREWSITKDGSNLVSQWKDLSGGNRHFVQATGAAQPLYVPNVLNGRPVLRFDGSNDFLESSALGFTGDQPMSLFIVNKAAASIAICGFSGVIGNEGGLYSTSMDFSSRQVRVAGTITVYHIKTYIKQAGAINPNGTIYYNGQGTTTYSGTTPETFVPNYNVNSKLQLARWYNNYGGNDIAEIVLYNRALSTAERNKVERYLNQKYKIF